MIVPIRICSCVIPIFIRASGCFSAGPLQSPQIRRDRRWASTRLTEAVTRNGSTPMLRRRDTVDGASLVWSVDSTRWPVSAALTAISAVSKSRISPTMMMFGSWRRNARSAVAKFRPMSSCIWTWLIPCRLNSTGSSAVEMLRSSVLSSDIAEYSVVVLPDPVGPVTSTIPYGFEIAYLKSPSGLTSKPSFVMSSCRFVLSRRRMTIFSPNSVGRTETRKSISRLLPILSLMRPSCGSRRSAMSSDAMILRREVIALRSLSGGRISSWRMPSMRNRTRRLFSYGSTWMSDAFFLIAESRIALHSLTTGASPAWFSRSTTLTFSSDPAEKSTFSTSNSPIIWSRSGPLS